MDRIPGFWRFHAIYLVLAVILAWAFFPFGVYFSFLLIAAMCLLGLGMLLTNQYMGAQILAFSVGLGTPIVFFAQLTLFGSGILFGVLITAVFLARDFLFFR